MDKTTVSRSRVKPERRCRLSRDTGNPDVRRILTLSVGTESFRYWLRAIPADWGQAWELENWGSSEVYHVHFDPETGNSCDCRGFVRWGHCKHRDAVLALHQAGRV